MAKIAQHKIIKGNIILDKVLNGIPTAKVYTIGCKKCHKRGFIGYDKNGRKVPCQCMLKQVDYASL